MKDIIRRDQLPYAASAKQLSSLFGFSVSLIKRWDAQGMLTRLQAPYVNGSGKGAPVRYVVADFLEFLEAQPGSRVGSFKGRSFASLGDILR